MIAFGLTLPLLGAIYFFIRRFVSRPLGGEPAAATAVANRIAGGDLAHELSVVEVDTTSILAAMARMQHNLAGIIGQINEAAGTITIASREIAAGNADLSQRTEEQASSLEETASSMEELTSTVKQNAENAKQANQLAIGASAVALKGGAVVSEVVGTMSSINESSKKIVDIISVIDGIAFQTNILALNAAVEAARAGEQGRGFAVVASEVRNLAQRSAAAAKEIKSLIEDSVGKVDSGAKLVDEAGRTMQEIVASVKRVTDIMSEITAASQEQSAGIEQVNQAITQMDEVTQQNAALVEAAAAARVDAGAGAETHAGGERVQARRNGSRRKRARYWPAESGSAAVDAAGESEAASPGQGGLGQDRAGAHQDRYRRRLEGILGRPRAAAFRQPELRVPHGVSRPAVSGGRKSAVRPYFRRKLPGRERHRRNRDAVVTKHGNWHDWTIRSGLKSRRSAVSCSSSASRHASVVDRRKWIPPSATGRVNVGKEA